MKRMKRYVRILDDGDNEKRMKRKGWRWRKTSPLTFSKLKLNRYVLLFKGWTIVGTRTIF